MTNNEQLLEIVLNNVGDPRAMYVALIAREDAVLDNLRVAASAHGLLPSVVQFTLIQLGLGTPVTPEEFVMIRTQAEAEVRRINEQQAEGGDTS